MQNISKFLSFVLRHRPQEINLILDANGWANVEELIQKSADKGTIFSKNELEIIVETNEKKRFTFNDDKTKIRANQGHSIEIDLALTPVSPPIHLYHGTAEKNLETILKKGILKMNRQHVHLSLEKETALQVGSRHGKPKILTVLSGQMNNDGLLFFQSKNGVWLTEFVDSKYILQK